MKNVILGRVGVIVLVLAGAASSQLALAGTWATFDAPGAEETAIMGIDGSNIVGYYIDGSGQHGFLYDGLSWTILPGVPLGVDDTKIVGGHGGGAFIYDITDSTWETFNAQGADPYTTAEGIDGSNIVGQYDLNGFMVGGVHSFIYDGST
ncbi:MAG: hypothetical protein JW749_01765 [Sedimentisphaerales bacterium]|nr:hypothetical protein [Sedimentisphaerales bacterium]